MSLRTLLSLLIVNTLIAIGVSAADIYIHFGQNSISDYGWNSNNTYSNGNGGNVGTPLSLIDSSGSATSVTLTTVEPFYHTNNQGYTGGAVGDFAANAVSSSLYHIHGGGSVVSDTPTIEFGGLNPNSAYSFEVYACRASVSEDRSATYTFTGTNSDSADLNPSSNTTNTALVENIVPDSNGEISFVTSKGSTSVSNYFYLGALIIRETPPLTGDIIIKKTPSAPIIDGVPDLLWDAVEGVDLENVFIATPPVSTANCSATVKAVWDDDYLYFYFDVTDDAYSQDSTYAWQDDSVHLYFDPDNSGGTSYDSGDAELIMRRDDTQALEGSTSTPFGGSGVVDWAVTEHTGGYRVEVVVDWAGFGSVTPEHALEFGIDFQVNDDDNGGSPDVALKWFDTVGTGWQNPSLFGTAQLSDEEIDVGFPGLDCDDCDFVIGVGTSTDPFDGDTYNVQPGDKIGIPAGTNGRISIRDVHGTAQNPVIISNCDGKAVISSDNAYGIKLDNCSFVRLTGTGSQSDFYGIEVTGPEGDTSLMGVTFEEGCTDFEVDHLEIHGQGFAGIAAKQDPTCDLTWNRGNYTMYNPIIHDNYIHDNDGEGMYIGNSFYGGFNASGCGNNPLYPHDIIGLRVYDNITRNTGCEGIQVGCAVEDTLIYRNYIFSPGQNPFANFQNRGLQLGAGTSAEVFDNFVSDVPSLGMVIQGEADSRVYNNVVVRSAGFIVAGGTANSTFTGYEIYNNTIIDSSEHGMNVYNVPGATHKIKNNLIVDVNTAGGYEAIHKTGTFTIDTSGNLYLPTIASGYFADPNNDDYHLTSSSPAVDAGDDLSSVMDAVDFDDNPRDEDWDVGAFELQQ